MRERGQKEEGWSQSRRFLGKGWVWGRNEVREGDVSLLGVGGEGDECRWGMGVGREGQGKGYWAEGRRERRILIGLLGFSLRLNVRAGFFCGFYVVLDFNSRDYRGRSRWVIFGVTGGVYLLKDFYLVFFKLGDILNRRASISSRYFFIFFFFIREVFYVEYI